MRIKYIKTYHPRNLSRRMLDMFRSIMRSFNGSTRWPTDDCYWIFDLKIREWPILICLLWLSYGSKKYENNVEKSLIKSEIVASLRLNKKPMLDKIIHSKAFQNGSFCKEIICANWLVCIVGLLEMCSRNLQECSVWCRVS